MQIEIKDRLGLNLKKWITCIICQRDVSERPIILVHCGLHGLSLLFVLHFYSFLSLIISQSRECVLIFPGFVSLRFFFLFVCSPPLALPSLTHTCCLACHGYLLYLPGSSGYVAVVGMGHHGDHLTKTRDRLLKQ